MGKGTPWHAPTALGASAFSDCILGLEWLKERKGVAGLVALQGVLPRQALEVRQKKAQRHPMCNRIPLAVNP
jgi:hypothetical protein